MSKIYLIKFIAVQATAEMYKSFNVAGGSLHNEETELYPYHR